MAYKHIQQHNIWPISWATLLSAATIIFTIGSIHARFTVLEEQYKDHAREDAIKFDRINNDITSLRLKDRENLTVLDKNNRVLGIATHEPKLVITPKRTPTPTERIEVSPTENP